MLSTSEVLQKEIINQPLEMGKPFLKPLWKV